MPTPDKKMQSYKSKLKPLVRLEGFTLLELLIVMSIIALLVSILLPCLMRAKESAYELCAIQTQVDKEGKVRLQIGKPDERKAHDDIYMIEINPPKDCRFYLRKPYPSGMKLVKRDGRDYIKWRPKWEQIGLHLITVVFEGQEPAEQQIKVSVYNKELMEAEMEKRNESH